METFNSPALFSIVHPLDSNTRSGSFSNECPQTANVSATGWGLFSNAVYNVRSVVFKVCGDISRGYKILSGAYGTKTIGKKMESRALKSPAHAQKETAGLPLLTAALAAAPGPPSRLPVRPLVSTPRPHPVCFHDESQIPTRRNTFWNITQVRLCFD